MYRDIDLDKLHIAMHARHGKRSLAEAWDRQDGREALHTGISVPARLYAAGVLCAYASAADKAQTREAFAYFATMPRQ